ncbi:hypothetical protein IMG5_156920 [Ichthyophthirius multifiliis]|uniref:PAS domain-containing protein n=1 Tax=Ichthyophthirius multifiliis TaxID=5932 RepID=G0QZH6_ICHMU|nr:hypothetical protein IMG5_156920 [Ichthyophthirius multifiliis]EGR29365.1 hypothetical protein IMG5_156920 [Ichthyophthirius multifiliis]|eukprot:XP_004030601.1 hypothetical protein IMG5_156920 [Ichthyophthirius multifiliis]
MSKQIELKQTIDLNKQITTKYQKNASQTDQNKQKNEKQLSILNFTVALDLLMLKKSSIEQAYLMILVCFFVLNISSLHKYNDFLISQYNLKQTNLNELINIVKYLDILYLLSMSSTSYLIVLIFSVFYFLMLFLLFLICFLKKYINTQIKPRKYFFGRWFVILGQLFNWILFMPLIITQMSYLFCLEDIFSQIKIICSSSSVYFYISIIGLFFGILDMWYLGIFFFNSGNQSKKDALACDYSINLLKFDFCRFIISIFVCFKFQSYSYSIFYIFLNNLISGYLVYLFLFADGLFTFKNKQIKDFFQIQIIIYFANQISQLFDQTTRQIIKKLFYFIYQCIKRALKIYNLDSEKILYYLIFNIFILVILFKKLQKYQIIKHLKEIQIYPNTFNDIRKKIYLFSQFMNNQQEAIYSDAYFKGMIFSHLNSDCNFNQQQYQCYCKCKNIYDSKKNKLVNCDKYLQNINRNVLCKFFIKNWIESYINKNYKDYQVYIDYAEFQYFKFNNYNLALQYLTISENSFLYLIDQFRIFRLRHFILKQNKKRNKKAYKSKLEIEKVIPIEIKIDEIKERIKYIISLNITFWQTLQKSKINLQECNKIALSVQIQIKELKKLWININNYLDYRKKWKFYFAWYILYILNKKVKISLIEKFSGINNVNETDIFSEEIQNYQVEDEIDQAENTEQINIKKIAMTFDKKSCVFIVNSDSKGKILQINKSVTQIFGYNKFEIENQYNITSLMPFTYSSVHPKLINQFYQTGKSKAMYSQRRIFCQNKQGQLFAAWKFIKQYVTLQGQSQFIALIRPITFFNGRIINFIIFNEDWEIESMSKELFDLFGDSENKILKVNNNQNQEGIILNLFLVIPKLLQFSRFYEFLTEDDLVTFGLKKKEQFTGIANIIQRPKKISLKNNDLKINSNNIFFDKIKAIAKKKSNQIQMKKQQQLSLLTNINNNEEQQNLSNQNIIQKHLNQSNSFAINNNINYMDESNANLIQESKEETFNTPQISLNQQSQRLYKNQFSLTNEQNNENNSKLDQSYQISEDTDFEQDDLQFNGQIDLRLEKQECLRFIAKIPVDGISFMQSYYRMIQNRIMNDKKRNQFDSGNCLETNLSRPQTFNKKQTIKKDENQTQNELNSSKITQYMENNQQTDVFSNNQRDKILYSIIKDIYLLHIKRTKQKSIKITCVTEFKKIGNARIGIMKISNLEQIKTGLYLNNLKQDKSPSPEFQKPKIKISFLENLNNSFVLNFTNKLDNRQSLNNETLKISKSNGLGYQLNSDNQKNIQKDSQIFQNDFNNKKGVRNYSFNAQENIYVKEDNNKPKKQINTITSIKLFIRLFFIAFIFFNLFIFFLIPFENYTIFQDQASRCIQLKQLNVQILEGYDYILDQIMINSNIYNNQNIQGSIFQNTNQFQENNFQNFIDLESYYSELNLNLDIKKSIFDPNIIEYNSISKYILKTKRIIQFDQKQFKLDNFDIFEQNIYYIQMLSKKAKEKKLNELNENSNELIFSRFFILKKITYINQNKQKRNYIVQKLINNLDIAEDNIINFFIENVDNVQYILYLFLIIESITILLSFLVLVKLIFIVCNSFQSILESFIYIKQKDIKIILDYNYYIQEQFNYVTQKDEYFSVESNRKVMDEAQDYQQNNNIYNQIKNKQFNFNLLESEDTNNNFIKRQKNINNGKLLRKLKIRSLIYFLVFSIITIGSSFSFLLDIKTSMDSLEIKIRNFQFFKTTISYNTIVLIILKEMKINLNNYKQNIQSNFQNFINIYQNQKWDQNLLITNEGNFNYNFQKIYFNNPCIQYSNLWKEQNQSQECNSVVQNAMQNGLSNFNLRLSIKISDDIKDPNIKSNQNLNVQDLIDYSRGNYYKKKLQQFLLETWNKDIQEFLSLQKMNDQILISIMIVSLIGLYIIIAEYILIKQFINEYQQYKYIYKMYMPDAIITKEKRIKYWLIKHGILKQQLNFFFL